MTLSLRPLIPDLYPPGAFQIPREFGACRVGRDSGNDLQVFHGSVSSRHALLEVGEGESVDVVDCGSTNGTFVNGIRVVDRRAIAAGDLIRFAMAEFRVSADPAITGEDESAQKGSTEPIVAVKEKVEGERERLAAGVDSLIAERGQLTSRLVANEVEITSLQGTDASLAGREEAIRRLNREVENYARSEQRHQQQLRETRNALMDREGSIAALNYEISRRDSSLRQLGEQHDELQRAYDQYATDHAALEVELAARKEELAGAIVAKDRAEATSSGIVARLFELGGRLLGDWQFWFRDERHGEPSADPAVVFARVEGVAARIRGELDLIEPIWHQFGEVVQDELRRRCDRLREEEAGLLAETEARRVELAGVMENLEQAREFVDTEVRRAQGLSRRGTEIEIPARFESMVIARDREQEIYRALIERLEVLDRFLTGYRGSRQLKEVVIELGEFRSRLAAILESSGVQIFEVPVRTMLTLKHRREVQILTRKGWGIRRYTEYPFQPGEVIKVIRPGYRVGEGEYAVILRKVEVLIRGVDE
jgi:hypothetical protein